MLKLLQKNRPGKLTLISIILLNLITLIIAINLDWKTFDLVLLFWTENLAIGLFNVPKMIIAFFSNWSKKGNSFFPIPFFIAHFSIFCFGHGVIITKLFGEEKLEGVHMAEPVVDLINTPTFFSGLIIMCSIQAIFFVTRFIFKGEYKSSTVSKQMFEPYKRIFITQALLMGLAVMIFMINSESSFNADSILTLCLFFVIKIIIDIQLYRSDERKKKTTD
ncbi:MAG: hypothetical protein ACI857_000137 [Arenicella sp.]|jgi:hypothetical protein